MCKTLTHPSNQPYNATKRLLKCDPPLVSHTHNRQCKGWVLAHYFEWSAWMDGFKDQRFDLYSCFGHQETKRNRKYSVLNVSHLGWSSKLVLPSKELVLVFLLLPILCHPLGVNFSSILNVKIGQQLNPTRLDFDLALSPFK